MSQLNLNIRPRLLYAAENFVLHAGVRDVAHQILEFDVGLMFRLFFIEAESRTGKTHFSIKLADALTQRGLFPRLVEGAKWREWIDESLATHPIEADHIVIIDDAQDALAPFRSGQSGPFVNFVETMRVKSARLVLLSRKPLDSFSFDEHILSRLLPGSGYLLRAPSEGDMPHLIRMMARQRGISLTERKVQYLLRRLERNVPSIEEYFDKLNYLSQVLGKAIRFPLISDAI